MVKEQKSRRWYAYKSDCGVIIEIDLESKECSDFFSGVYEKNEPIMLRRECPDPDCSESIIFKRSDIDNKIFPLYKGVKWETYREND